MVGRGWAQVVAWAMLACGITAATVMPARAQSGALEVPYKAAARADAPEAGKVRLYAKSKALVIGIDAYTGNGWPKLSNAYNDAKAVADALKAQDFDVALKRDLKSDELDRTLKDFFVVEGADKEVRLFLWFAGHGYTTGDGEGYLVPADAAGPQDDAGFRRRAISMRQFGYYMREAKSKHVLAVFDSCFAGSVFNVARSTPSPAITLATAEPVRQFVSSGEASQEVSDDGTFRKLFLDALAGKEVQADANGDGYITGTELGLFLHDKLTNLTRNKQTPRYGKLNALGFDRGDFVFEAGRLKAPPPVAAPASSSMGSAAEVVRVCREVEAMTSLTMLAVLERQHAGTPVADCISARIGELKAAADQARADVAARTKADETARAKAADTERQRLAMVDQQRQDEARKAEATMQPGRVFRDCNDGCPEMVVVPAGSFTMGSADGGNNEKPTRKVTISKPFAVGKFEVTFAEWEVCVAGGGCASNKSPEDQGWGKGRRPVINVSWDDAKEYVAWLSRKTGKTYRLLSEAEWEYAARGGTTTKYAWGDAVGKGNANCSACGSQWDDKQTAPAGSFKPNPFGLHDMHGNVWEWVEDCYHKDYSGAPVDGSAWTTGSCEKVSDGTSSRVLRGGSWYGIPQVLRSAYRVGVHPVIRYSIVGFRISRTLFDP